MEGKGVEPDVSVDNEPAREYAGIDDHLNRAIDEIKSALAKRTRSPISSSPQKIRANPVNLPKMTLANRSSSLIPFQTSNATFQIVLERKPFRQAVLKRRAKSSPRVKLKHWHASLRGALASLWWC